MVKMLKPKKTLKFGGKAYIWHEYEPMKSLASKIAEQLRSKGFNARVVAQPGYYGGGWNIYIRKRK